MPRQHQRQPTGGKSSRFMGPAGRPGGRPSSWVLGRQPGFPCGPHTVNAADWRAPLEESAAPEAAGRAARDLDSATLRLRRNHRLLVALMKMFLTVMRMPPSSLEQLLDQLAMDDPRSDAAPLVPRPGAGICQRAPR